VTNASFVLRNTAWVVTNAACGVTKVAFVMRIGARATSTVAIFVTVTAHVLSLGIRLRAISADAGLTVACVKKIP
jgi:hypothetical protein